MWVCASGRGTRGRGGSLRHHPGDDRFLVVHPVVVAVTVVLELLLLPKFYSNVFLYVLKFFFFLFVSEQ